MKLWCFDEGCPPCWGQHLYRAASERGHQASIFRNGHGVEGGYAFMHIRQQADSLKQDQALAEELHERTTLIPGIDQVRLYEDKVAQFRTFGHYMPETVYFTHPDAAVYLEFPFISKSREGSASVNVRLIRDKHEADREVELAFGDGLPMHRERLQKGYLLWQKLCQGNPGDYRVIRIGRQRLVLRRWNRKNVPFASGSGAFTPITERNNEVDEVLQCAERYFDEFDARWCGIDLVHDPDEAEWKILETTVGWTFHVYLECRFLDTPYDGGDTWQVLVNEIEAGAFC